MPSFYSTSGNLWLSHRRLIVKVCLAAAILLAAFMILSLAAPLKAMSSEPVDPYGPGVKVYEPEQCCEGYTVFTMFLPPPYSVTLINMMGGTIKEWKNADGCPVCGCPPKMLPDGSIIGYEGHEPLGGDFKELVQHDWNGQLTWSSSDWVMEGGQMSARVHHDFQREGNPVGYYAPDMEPMVSGGNTLVLAHSTEHDFWNVHWAPVTDPVIYEVDENGERISPEEGGFEWHAIEHYRNDEFGFKPEAKGIIWLTGGLFGDYLHFNSMSELGPNKWYEMGDERFNPENIIVSARNANFSAIIDRGSGEIVWRVGPDYVGTPDGDALGQIVGQHHTHMIPKGLPGEGNILMFDNGGIGGYPLKFRGYSRVIEFEPRTVDDPDKLNKVWEYKYTDGSLFVPTGPEHQFNSAFVSSAQRLPNGNTFITEGMNGRLFEVKYDEETQENTIVWEYLDGPGAFGTMIYRAYRVPPEWVPGNPDFYEEWDSLYYPE